MARILRSDHLGGLDVLTLDEMEGWIKEQTESGHDPPYDDRICVSSLRKAVSGFCERGAAKRVSRVQPCERVKGAFVVKLNVRDRESIQEAVRRFRKLVERSGIKKEMRRKEYYEKPSETRRRARLRAERRTRRMRTPTAL